MRLFVAIVMIAIAAMLTGCGGGKGSSEPPPKNVKATPGDSSVSVTWDVDPSLEYWVWVTPGTTIDTNNCASQCRIFVNVFPPFIASGLVNGTTYTLTVNARKEGGPGGDGSPPETFVPRLAGFDWTAGVPLGTNNLLGIGFISATSAGISTVVEVGADGTAFYSLDAQTWTAATTNVTANLNAVQYRNGLFVAIGDGGTIITSPDGATWTARTSPTTNSLTALVGNGQGQVIAVGKNGTILVSTDSTTWTTANSGTTEDLYGVAFGNSRYVAVGAHGTLIASDNGTTWAAITPVVGADLHGITYGSLSATSTTPAVARFIAVGTAGTVITSTDGLNWVAEAPLTTNNLASVAFGSQFVTVGAGGVIFTSLDGLTWHPADSGTATDLNAVAFTILTAKSIGIGYLAVGNAGTNLTSF
ncbi:MAG TPA: hypothetical protein VJ891_10675 [Casimicrobiaceae bacterium]|nr:hypothetical protein [Casimicrobiaceae bacterium]